MKTFDCNCDNTSCHYKMTLEDEGLIFIGDSSGDVCSISLSTKDKFRFIRWLTKQVELDLEPENVNNPV